MEIPKRKWPINNSITSRLYQVNFLIGSFLEVVFWVIRDVEFQIKLLTEMIFIVTFLFSNIGFLFISQWKWKNQQINVEKSNSQFSDYMKLLPPSLVLMTTLILPFNFLFSLKIEYSYFLIYLAIYFFYTNSVWGYVELRMAKVHKCHLKVDENELVLIQSYSFLNINQEFQYSFEVFGDKFPLILAETRDKTIQSIGDVNILENFANNEGLSLRDEEFYTLIGIIKKSSNYYTKIIGSFLFKHEIMDIIRHISSYGKIYWLKPIKPLRADDFSLEPLIIQTKELEKLQN